MTQNFKFKTDNIEVYANGQVRFYKEVTDEEMKQFNEKFELDYFGGEINFQDGSYEMWTWEHPESFLVENAEGITTAQYATLQEAVEKTHFEVGTKILRSH